MKVYTLEIKHVLVSEGPAIQTDSPARVVEYMRGAFDDYPLQEQVWVIALNTKNFPIGRHRISIGDATGAHAHPREVFRFLTLSSATRFILVHNHPSGNPEPSNNDVALTRRMREVGELMLIGLADHVILGEVLQDPNGRGFYSFREAGLV